MEAPADHVAEFGFGAPALAMRACRQQFLPLQDGLRIGLGSYRFSNAPLLIGCVFGTGTKFDGAIAVVVSLHGETA